MRFREIVVFACEGDQFIPERLVREVGANSVNNNLCLANICDFPTALIVNTKKEVDAGTPCLDPIPKLPETSPWTCDSLAGPINYLAVTNTGDRSVRKVNPNALSDSHL